MIERILPIFGIGQKIGAVIKVIKSLFSTFKESSVEAGNTDSINDNSSLDNVDRIIQIFSNFKEEVHVRSTEIESSVIQEIDYYVEELNNLLEDNEDKVEKYNINLKRIERRINKISSRIKGVIDNEVSKKISLDNKECKEIVKMIPGAKKESAMNSFFSTCVREALTTCCDEMRSTLDDIYQDVEVEVLGAVDVIQKQNMHLQETYAAVNESDYEITAKKQMIDAYYLIDTCDMINEII